MKGKLDLGKKTTKTRNHTWEVARNTPVSLLPPEKRNIQTYTSNTKTPFCASRPNYAPDSHSRGGWDVCPVAQRRSQAQTSMHPAFFFLRTGPWPMAAQFIIQFYWSSVTEHIKKNSGVSWSRGPDPIVFCKSKKDQLSMAQICILHPRICCHTHTKKKKKKKAVQTSGTISPLSRAAMMSAF